MMFSSLMRTKINPIVLMLLDILIIILTLNKTVYISRFASRDHLIVGLFIVLQEILPLVLIRSANQAYIECLKVCHTDGGF